MYLAGISNKKHRARALKDKLFYLKRKKKKKGNNSLLNQSTHPEDDLTLTHYLPERIENKELDNLSIH